MHTEEEYQKLLNIIEAVICLDNNSYGVAGTGISDKEYLKICEIIPELEEFKDGH